MSDNLQKRTKISLRLRADLHESVERFRRCFAAQWHVQLTLTEALVMLLEAGLSRQTIVPGAALDEADWTHLPDRPCEIKTGITMMVAEVGIADPTCPSCAREARFLGHEQDRSVLDAIKRSGVRLADTSLPRGASV